MPDSESRTRRRLGGVALAVGLLCVVTAGPPAAAAGEVYPVGSDGSFAMQGGGWGHGRGMSQWGAHQAATEGRTHADILGFYYPGTTLEQLPASSVRVLLSTDTGRTLIVRAASGLTVRLGQGEPSVLPDSTSGCAQAITRWRVKAMRTTLRLQAYCGRWRTFQRTRADSAEFANPGGLVSTQNGQVRRGYRGAVSATRTSGRSLQVVNTVDMESYLRPVVAAEVSPSWPTESLRAQAVAARSYAAHEVDARSGRSFHVYDVIRSQAYPGAVVYDRRWRVVDEREYPRTDAAIRDTAGVHVTADGSPALTQFGSSNGGATAASPLAYMRAKVDPWDTAATRNSRRTWTDTVSAADLARRFPAVGRVTAIEVVSREGAGRWGGRIAELRIVGTSSSATVRGDSSIRAALGTYSSMMTFGTG